MAFRIRLSSTDRERFDVPEEILVDLAKVGQTESEILDELEDPIDADNLGTYLRGTPVINDDGSPVLDEDGDPVTRTPKRALRLLVWLALRGVGKEVDFDTFNFERHGVSIRADVPKDPETSPPTESPSEA